MKNLQNQIRNTKGITLIALIITIIVLLILAGVVINMTIGNDGIISKAQSSADMYQNAQEKENSMLAQVETEMDKYMGGSTGGGAGGSGGGPVSLTYSGATQETVPYLPNANCTFKTGTSLANGLVMVDENSNEWVWVEVPKSITASATTASEIYNALDIYILDVYREDFGIRDGYSTDRDTWKNADASITLSGVITEDKYNTNKEKMLQSIKVNGGFWVGRYEAGIADGKYRTAATDASNSATALSNFNAIIQQNAKPYNYVTCKEAEELSEGLAPAGTNTASLMYGIQWELVLRYLYEKTEATGLSLDDINRNSKSWGNYYDATISLNRGQYDEADITTESMKNNWANVSNIGANKVTNTYILLTTGASDDTSKMNIYDIAGNVAEWTLRRCSSIDYPCVTCGGEFPFTGARIPAMSSQPIGSFSTSLCGYRFPPGTLLVGLNANGNEPRGYIRITHKPRF